MSACIVIGPAVEPISVEEAKAHLRVSDHFDDHQIASLIRTARAKCESFTRLALIERISEIVLHGFPPSIRVPLWPVRSVEAITYTAPDGSVLVLDPTQYQLDETGRPRFIVPSFGECWPIARDDVNGVRVRVKAGFGANAADIPDDLRHAMLLMIGAFYENREAVVLGTIATEIPMGAKDLMHPHVFYF